MKNEGVIFILAGVAAFIYFKSKAPIQIKNSAQALPIVKEPSFIDTLINSTGLNIMNKWTPPKSAANYLYFLNDASKQYSLPENLLARVAMQESSFNPKIISGEIKSPAGAVGLMQIVPKWHPNVNPTDPVASIYYAAKFLRDLYKQFGNWKDALSAYNWGSGNLTKFKNGQIKTMPRETINYYTKILGDLGL